MKIKTSIKCFILLVSILFSLSVNAYNSITQYNKVSGTFSKKTHVDEQTNKSLASNDLLFEELENENDGEDFPSEASYILPFTFASLYLQQNNVTSIAHSELQKTSSPLFLSIRVLRI